MTTYCGCCGRKTGAADWCPDCLPHIATFGPAWERTWFAQHGTRCPFEPRKAVAA